jgi:hypothetical protein
MGAYSWLMVMMGMVMKVVMMVSVMVILVPEALRQVGWLRQRQRKASTDSEHSIGQSFHKLRVIHPKKLPVENSTTHEYAPTWLMPRLVELQRPGTGRYEAGGVWHVAGSR